MPGGIVVSWQQPRSQPAEPPVVHLGCSQVAEKSLEEMGAWWGLCPLQHCVFPQPFGISRMCPALKCCRALEFGFLDWQDSLVLWDKLRVKHCHQVPSPCCS